MNFSSDRILSHVFFLSADFESKLKAAGFEVQPGQATLDLKEIREREKNLKSPGKSPAKVTQSVNMTEQKVTSIRFGDKEKVSMKVNKEEVPRTVIETVSYTSNIVTPSAGPRPSPAASGGSLYSLIKKQVPGTPAGSAQPFKSPGSYQVLSQGQGSKNTNIFFLGGGECHHDWAVSLIASRGA